jgi:hypothetical protein
MPNSVVKSFSDKSGKSIATVEKLWQAAVESVKKSNPDMKESNDRFYPLVTGLLKKMLKIDEEAGAGAGAGAPAGGGTPVGGPSTTTSDIAQFAKRMVAGPEERKRKRKFEKEVNKFL